MSTPNPKQPPKSSSATKATVTTLGKVVNFERYANPHSKPMRMTSIIGTCAFLSIIGYFAITEYKNSKSKEPKKK